VPTVYLRDGWRSAAAAAFAVVAGTALAFVAHR
jgi:rhodanese-related sulfurtransferase